MDETNRAGAFLIRRCAFERLSFSERLSHPRRIFLKIRRPRHRLLRLNTPSRASPIIFFCFFLSSSRNFRGDGDDGEKRRCAPPMHGRIRARARARARSCATLARWCLEGGTLERTLTRTGHLLPPGTPVSLHQHVSSGHIHKGAHVHTCTLRPASSSYVHARPAAQHRGTAVAAATGRSPMLS